MVFPSVSVYDRADAFLARKDAMSRDEVREWLPEIEAAYGELHALWEKTAYQTHTHPDPELSRRLNGLLILIGKAELVGVVDILSGEQNFYGLREDDSEEYLLYPPEH